MKIIRKYVTAKNFTNIFVRRGIVPNSRYCCVIRSAPDVLMVCSFDDAEINNNVADVLAFDYLHDHPEQTGCIAVAVNEPHESFDIEDKLLTDCTLIIVENGRVTCDLKGRLDNLLPLGVISSYNNKLPVVIDSNIYGTYLDQYKSDLRISDDVEFHIHNINLESESTKQCAPKPLTVIKNKYKITIFEKVIAVGSVLIMLIVLIMGYVAYNESTHKAPPVKQEPVKVTPLLGYNAALKGNHVIQTLNFGISTLGRYNKLVNWHYDGITIQQDGHFTVNFSPDYPDAPIAPFILWMRNNSTYAMKNKGTNYFINGTMPKQVDYMSRFKNNPIDTEFIFAQLMDLGRFAGFPKIAKLKGKRNSDYTEVNGSISGVVERSQLESF